MHEQLTKGVIQTSDTPVPSHFIRNLQVLGRRLENGQLDWKTFVLEVSAKVQIHCATHDFSPGAPDALSFEHFLPWIYKIMLAYQEQEEPENEQIKPEGIRYSKAYYTKRFR